MHSLFRLGSFNFFQYSCKANYNKPKSFEKSGKTLMSDLDQWFSTLLSPRTYQR